MNDLQEFSWCVFFMAVLWNMSRLLGDGEVTWLFPLPSLALVVLAIFLV